MKEIDPKNAALEPMTYVPGRTTSWNTSWRQVYDYFGPAIIAYAKLRGLNEHSSQDVLQEVMLTLIRCQHGQERGYNRQLGSFQAWLWGVIRNRLRAVGRRDRKEEPAPPIEPDNESDRRLREVAEPPEDFAKREEDVWKQSMLAAALLRVQARVTSRNFKIYMSLLQQTSTPQLLAGTYSMEANAIYRVKNRCDEMLLEEAKILRDAWDDLQQEPND